MKDILHYYIRNSQMDKAKNVIKKNVENINKQDKKWLYTPDVSFKVW